MEHIDIGEIEERVNEYVERLQLKERVDTHPYLAVAAAAGLGFVLAGGLFTRLARRVAGFGVRRLVIPIALERLVASKSSTPE